jgi:hypothetical protein
MTTATIPTLAPSLRLPVSYEGPGGKDREEPEFIAATVAALGVKGNPVYHQSVRSSRKGLIHKYSDSALHHLAEYFQQNPDFDPYHVAKASPVKPEVLRQLRLMS